jgi:hypothetical protein
MQPHIYVEQTLQTGSASTGVTRNSCRTIWRRETDSSSDVGLNVGIWRDLEDRDLPGRPAPKIGHQTTKRYLQTVEELKYLLRLFRSG